jgi:type IV pilus assembly protein PilM
MIGLDISDRSMKLVQLSNDSRRTLLSHCWHTIPAGAIEQGVVQDASLVQKVLVETFAQCRLSAPVGDAVVASIPETQSFMRVIEVPVMQEDEIAEAIQWEVAQHIPFGLEKVYLDWQPIGGGHAAAAGRQEVLVGAAQRKVIDPLVAVFQQVGLDVAALELESQALARALISPELRRQQGLLLVDIGGTATNVIIHDHGAQQLEKTLSEEDRGHFVEPRQEALIGEDAERIAQLMQPAQEQLAAEIRGVVDFYNSMDTQHKVHEILLTGGGSNFPGFDRVIVRYFDNVHVQRGNPWANILSGAEKKPPLLVHESVHFATAFGLALRHVFL